MNAFFQDFQGLADLVSYRIDGQSQFFGNLLILQSVTFAEDEDLAAFFGKRVNRGSVAKVCVSINK